MRPPSEEAYSKFDPEVVRRADAGHHIDEEMEFGLSIRYDDRWPLGSEVSALALILCHPIDGKLRFTVMRSLFRTCLSAVGGGLVGLLLAQLIASSFIRPAPGRSISDYNEGISATLLGVVIGALFGVRAYHLVARHRDV
jgi:hypothetical protein